MTFVENLDMYSAHSGKHLYNADPGHFDYPSVVEFVNAETGPIEAWDFDDDPILTGLRKRLGLLSEEEKPAELPN